MLGSPSVNSDSNLPSLSTDEENLPRITILIAAHNAASHLENRLNNLALSHYPKRKLSIVIASDGSTDPTVEIGKRLERNVPGFQFIEYP